MIWLSGIFVPLKPHDFSDTGSHPYWLPILQKHRGG